MVTITVDNKQYQVDESKNLIDALKDVGIEIPYFCYHPKLSVVGMCRICLIEMEGSPKLFPACNTAVQEGMKIRVASQKAVEGREGVMEFLLINHPLDCPRCDKSGECMLQDYSFTVGGPTTRYKEDKRVVPQESLGSNLLINHDRCILCHRCVRFDKEIVGVHDLEFSLRGRDTIIAYKSPHDTAPDEVDHNYQGALADICPVGALLNKNTLFASRVWWFEEKQSICHGCSTLCHVTTNVKKNEIYRYMPPENPEDNGYFICDQGRFSSSEFSRDRLFHYILEGHKSKSSIVLPQIQKEIEVAENILWLGGTIDSNEEIDELLSLQKELTSPSHSKRKNIMWEYRTQDYMWEEKWNEQIDFLLMRDQKPNSKALRERNISFFESKQKMLSTIKTNSIDIIFILNEFSSPYSYISTEPDLLLRHPLYSFLEENSLWEKVILLSTHENKASKKAHAALPIQAFVEKNAHFTNKKGEIKEAYQSIVPPQGLFNTSDLIKLLFYPLPVSSGVSNSSSLQFYHGENHKKRLVAV